MPKGSNCPLVQEYKPNLQVGYIQNRITVINKCANDMLAIHYTGCIREWQ